MKLEAQTNGKKYSVEIMRDGENLTACVDDRSYMLEASEPEANIFLFKHEGKIFQVFVSPQKDPGDPLQARIGTHELEIKLIDPKRLRGSSVSGEVAHGKAEIKTAMPGKVVRVLVAVGSEVQKGDGVIVVEAMKMQNELKSPKDGLITDIRFAEGDKVNSGDIMMIIE
jgi:biotin carboxyl carrier protein